jgi:hypothetical protein
VRRWNTGITYHNQSQSQTSRGHIPFPSVTSTLWSAVLRMHRAISITRARHVNGYSGYQGLHMRFCPRFQSRRDISTFHRGFLRSKHSLGYFSHGIKTTIPGSSRYISWSWKSRVREFTDIPDNEEDAARAAILDKVMIGRQPTDLMLRCEFALVLRRVVSLNPLTRHHP